MENVNFQVEQGDVVAIVGRNGSGKSTFLSIISGFLKPDGGEVLLRGENVFKSNKIHGQIGFVPQGDNLFEDLSVWDNIKFWAAASNVKLSKAEDCHFAKLLDLADFAKVKVKNCSGGIRRRTAVCVALLAEPDLLILDEPFSGLDLLYKNELINHLKKLSALGKTIIYSSHNGDEIADFSNRIVVIDQSKIVYQAQTKDLVAEPLNRLLLNLIKGENKE